MARRALISGISGQDGSYLAELLIRKGYDVHGTVRPELFARKDLLPAYLTAMDGKVTLHGGSLEDTAKFAALVRRLNCDECYHLAGPSTVDSDLLGEAAIFAAVLNSTRAILDAIEAGGAKCRFFFAGSSEMFGRASSAPQDERTAFRPRSLYGLAKLAAYHAIQQRRMRAGVFACTGILYNHESPRRPPVFLPRKVSLAVARIKLGLQQRLTLGNRDAVRDWGYAPDYVEAMWLMLQQPNACDFVIATGTTHSVEELVTLAFRTVGLDHNKYVDIDERFFRPTEATPLRGNSVGITSATGWKPKTSFEDLITEMVKNDLAEQAKGKASL